MAKIDSFAKQRETIESLLYRIPANQYPDMVFGIAQALKEFEANAKEQITELKNSLKDFMKGYYGAEGVDAIERVLGEIDEFEAKIVGSDGKAKVVTDEKGCAEIGEFKEGEELEVNAKGFQVGNVHIDGRPRQAPGKHHFVLVPISETTTHKCSICGQEYYDGAMMDPCPGRR
jgi:hypothetical protein